MINYELEICTSTPQACRVAQEGGAQRVELCASLPEGGTTPSYGAIVEARRAIDIALHIIIRPRGGNFVYSPSEVQEMKHDIEMARKIGADGVVFGCLTADGCYNKTANDILLKAAGGMSVTFHRAIDVSQDPDALLDILIERGYNRVLTSGAAPTAVQGVERLRRMVDRSAGCIGIMCGAGVTAENIELLAHATGAGMFHGTFKRPVLSVSSSAMTSAPFSFGETMEPDLEQIARARQILDRMQAVR